MEKKDVSLQLAEINQKLDLLVLQMQEQQRKQREFEELKDDLIHIGKDAFQTAVAELEEVAPHFETGDLVHLLKKLLRNTRNINRIIDQMESLGDFLSDAKGLSKNVFGELLETLDSMDRKGYFMFMQEAARIIDTVVTSFTVEDVKLLRENITSILLTVKNLTQPDMLSTMNNAVGFYKKMDIVIDRDVSFREILRELKDPEVKRGLVFMLEFVKSMANPANGEEINLKTQNNN